MLFRSGSFFETIPKDDLIHQMLLNVFRGHLENNKAAVPPNVIDQVEERLSQFTDQNIIAASQTIENASVKPRLRIMAEASAEGNPHSKLYPAIQEKSFNLILEESTYEKRVEEIINKELGNTGAFTGETKMFTIEHKMNGRYIVFQYQPWFSIG